MVVREREKRGPDGGERSDIRMEGKVESQKRAIEMEPAGSGEGATRGGVE